MCHGAPGVEPSEAGKGLQPDLPDLAEAVKEWAPAKLFWIVKHGVKMTGTPGFGPAQGRCRRTLTRQTLSQTVGWLTNSGNNSVLNLRDCEPPAQAAAAEYLRPALTRVQRVLERQDQT